MSDARKAYEQSRAMEPDAPVSDSDAGAPSQDERDAGAPAPGAPADAPPESPAAAGEGSAEATDADIEAASAAQPATAPDGIHDDDPSGDGHQTTDVAGETRPDDATDGRSLEELASALADAERQRDDYLDHLRRERAEFDNFRKRNARERLEAMDRGVQSLMTELLGVLDNFGHVLTAAQDSPDEALAKGAAMVHEELMGVLGRFGLEDVPGEGSAFDPQWHEAMMQVAAEEDVDEPVVVEVLRPGYRFKGRVLRPASVSVAQ